MTNTHIVFFFSVTDMSSNLDLSFDSLTQKQN